MSSQNIRLNNRRYHNKRKSLIAELKQKPCQDCAGWFESCQLDFDHRPGEKKLHQISSICRWNLTTILKEIVKCDVVCANCHRLRTKKRNQHASTVMINE